MEYKYPIENYSVFGKIHTVFNGQLWLARNKNFSMQFIGSGKTEKEALENMEETIQKYFVKKG